MRKIPNFVLLRAFEAAARLQSFTLAAHELHLTPSAISHQVRELEAVFGRPLFVRSHRRVDTTAEGRRLYESLSRILDSLEACCTEVNLAPSGQVLSVYCAPSFAAKWLSPRLATFMQANPGITIRLSSGAEPLDLTQAREVDLAITYGHALQRPGVEVTPLGKERIVPLCAPSLKDRKKNWRQQIAELTLIESQLNQFTWRDWFQLNGMDMPQRPRQSFDRGALSISAAVDGLGVALETTRFAERELARGELVEAGSTVFKHMDREMHFLSQRSNERQVDKVRRFKTWLISAVKG
ncbi:LysR substrate-binding domain-containing protein [Methylibium sp. Root1272]|uniref:LysR substrate-binding domain-containing protein n=1 Tax=Methylibium sp. Root1272 TaxID=1736441 RepID=UPI0006FACE4F|nr:LysR substrate-binding domain-containing protein [Methylibium sp. Root1272]KQW70079.1 LysR family transcriptional regulator [Methylibium sp. Root1272]